MHLVGFTIEIFTILLACCIKVCGRQHESKRKATILDILEVWQAAAVKICYPNFSVHKTKSVIATYDSPVRRCHHYSLEFRRTCTSPVCTASDRNT